MVLAYMYWENKIQVQYFCIRLKVLCMFAEIPILYLVKADRYRTQSYQMQHQHRTAESAKTGIKTSITFFCNFLLLKSNA